HGQAQAQRLPGQFEYLARGAFERDRPQTGRPVIARLCIDAEGRVLLRGIGEGRLEVRRVHPIAAGVTSERRRLTDEREDTPWANLRHHSASRPCAPLAAAERIVGCGWNDQ